MKRKYMMTNETRIDNEMINLKILVSYNQFCVFDATLDDPFNDWNDDHVRQGFSWRPKSVSFGAKENREIKVEVKIADSIKIDSTAFRVIAVPFTVPEHRKIIVGSIGDEHEVEIDAGIYRLIYELGSQNATPFCRLTFIADSHSLPEIIEADSEITKRNDLLMNATAAV
jgi:hypothetical protein